MDLSVVSDLHVEFHRDSGKSFIESLGRDNPFGNPDIFVLAGDIAVNEEQLLTVVRKASELFRCVVYVAGNHEYYYHTRQETLDYINEVCNKFKNVHFLDCDTLEVLGLRIHGCTLWYKDHPDSVLLENKLGDFQYIKNHNRFMYEEHQRAVDFLWDNVRKGDIVVTHTAPSPLSIHSQFSRSDVNNFFCTDLEALVDSTKPSLWLHGHVHNSFDYRIGGTRVICNPLGYVGIDENVRFRTDLLVTV